MSQIIFWFHVCVSAAPGSAFAHSLLVQVYLSPFNLMRTHRAGQKLLVLRATRMETVAERRAPRGSQGNLRYLHAAQLFVSSRQVQSCGGSRSPGEKNPAAILSPARQSNAPRLIARKRPREARRQTVVNTRGPKFTFAEQVQQPRVGKQTPGGSFFQGSCEQAGTLLRVQSLGFGALQLCGTQWSLLAVEGRQRSWDRS